MPAGTHRMSALQVGATPCVPQHALTQPVQPRWGHPALSWPVRAFVKFLTLVPRRLANILLFCFFPKLIILTGSVLKFLFLLSFMVGVPSPQRQIFAAFLSRHSGGLA